MGQEHSLPVQRRTPNKLSKPRTTSTANLFSKSAVYLGQKDGSSDVPGEARQYSAVFADPDVRQVNLQDERQGRQEQQEKRRSIFRSQSTPNRHSLPARPLEHTNFYNDYVEPQDNFVVEQSVESARPPNRSRMSLQHVPGLTYQQRLSLVQELPTPDPDVSKRMSTYAELRSPTLETTTLPRKASETNLYTPMRRSSFVQHGIATRPSLPHLLAPQVIEHNYSKPLPHAYIASLKQQDMPRVETPDELGHTGAFKLGSLRIMNGVASPTPSIERSVTMSAGEDYISAGNVRRLLEHRRDLSHRSNTITTAADRKKSPWMAREESPLKQAEMPPQIDVDFGDLTSLDFDCEIRLQSPSRAQALADDYINEVALSPYSFAPSRTPSPRLEATSKNTAIEDDLFEAEPSTPALSYAPSVTDSGYDGSSRAGSNRKKSLAKADSGYSSNVSLRSFRANSRPPPVPLKDTLPSQDHIAVSSVFSNPSGIRTQSSAENFPRKSSGSFTRPSSNNLSMNSVLSREDSRAYGARQVPLPDFKSNLMQPSRHVRTGSEPKLIPMKSRKEEKPRPFSVQVESQAHSPTNVPSIPAAASRKLDGRGDGFSVAAFQNNFQRLQQPGNRDTLTTIMSVGSGYTEMPVSVTRRNSRDVMLSAPSQITSNSYLPPKTPPNKLKKRSSFAYDMEAYENLQLTQQGVYNDDTQIFTEPQQRSRSITSEISSMIRNASAGSRTSSMTAAVGLAKKHSYEFISTRNPWSPPIDADFGPDLMGNISSTVDEPDRRLSWGSRDKKQPPVSMQTQRKISPSPSTNNLVAVPIRRPPPVPLTPISKDPQYSKNLTVLSPRQKSLPPSPLPIQVASPLPSPQTPWSFVQSPEIITDNWAEPRPYWLDGRRDSSDSLERPVTRRKSSYELNQRPQMSNRDSTSTMQSRSSGRRPPSTHQNGNLRIQRNMEAVKAKKMMEMMSPPLELSAHEQYQAEELARQRRERDTAGEMLAGWQANDDGSTPAEYHHTYGIAVSGAPRSPAYFPPPAIDDTAHSQDFHRRQNSTSDMLVIDRFSGGLDYGYEHGVGLSGSAGLRGGGGKKSVDVSRNYGLDFTDVPIFLHQVPGEGLRELHR